MKTKLFISLMLILASCGASKITNSKPIFTHINLYQYGKIELGDDINKFNNLIETKENRIYLKENVFGRSNSIELISNANNELTEFIFDYGNNISLESKITEYNYLGVPKRKDSKAIWNDKKTEFSIYQLNGSVFSKMKKIN
ncbi:hypothetical protein ACFSSB_03355 [Lacinutrix gracilariae]|uniref:Lipoprotein n=1 Tax=Lacinutrix gracilariae TaxID=1747198 RepID=A0ABW5K0L4_9FLAO